jgi:hypothetical protein
MQWPGHRLAEQPVRLSGEFLGAAVMLRSGHCCSTYLTALAQRVAPHTFLLTFPGGFIPATPTRPGTGPTDMA